MALVLQDNLKGNSRYAVWKIEEQESFYQSTLILSVWEQQYIASIKNNERRLRWFASRFLLKYVMDTNHFVELVFDEFGKPFISNFNCKVSISHSKNYAAVIIGGDQEVGIDIEESNRNIEPIKEKFLSTTELAQLQTENYALQLLIYWSAKEVMYKIYGKRKLEFKDDMFVKPFLLNQHGRVEGVLLKHGEVLNLSMLYVQKKEFTLVVGTHLDLQTIQ